MHHVLPVPSFFGLATSRKSQISAQHSIVELHNSNTCTRTAFGRVLLYVVVLTFLDFPLLNTWYRLTLLPLYRSCL